MSHLGNQVNQSPSPFRSLATFEDYDVESSIALSDIVSGASMDHRGWSPADLIFGTAEEDAEVEHLCFDSTPVFDFLDCEYQSPQRWSIAPTMSRASSSVSGPAATPVSLNRELPDDYRAPRSFNSSALFALCASVSTLPRPQAAYAQCHLSTSCNSSQQPNALFTAERSAFLPTQPMLLGQRSSETFASQLTSSALPQFPNDEQSLQNFLCEVCDEISHDDFFKDLLLGQQNVQCNPLPLHNLPATSNSSDSLYKSTGECSSASDASLAHLASPSAHFHSSTSLVSSDSVNHVQLDCGKSNTLASSTEEECVGVGTKSLLRQRLYNKCRQRGVDPFAEPVRTPAPSLVTPEMVRTKETRKRRNRESARKMRSKRKQLATELETKRDQLLREVESMRRESRRLQAEQQHLSSLLMSHVLSTATCPLNDTIRHSLSTIKLSNEFSWEDDAAD